MPNVESSKFIDSTMAHSNIKHVNQFYIVIDIWNVFARKIDKGGDEEHSPERCDEQWYASMKPIANH